jgi:hypothetical protein
LAIKHNRFCGISQLIRNGSGLVPISSRHEHTVFAIGRERRDNARTEIPISTQHDD